MISRFALFVLVALPIQLAFAQQLPGSDQNCTDAFGSTSDCSSQQQDQSSSYSRIQMQQGTGTQMQPGVEPRVPQSYTDRLDQQNRSQQREAIPSRMVPPEPLTEFQKFVASTTGQVLPIFGADLFARVPSTFAPLDLTPVPADFVVGPGDELRIRVWGQLRFEANVTVDRSGEVYLPNVGPVHVAGLPFSALAGQLRTAVGRVYRNFDLTVDLGRTRAIQVYVTGQARRPGVYTISSLSTLLDALFASGGPTAQGSLRHIELRRGGTLVTELDLYDLLTKGDKTHDAKLLPGDVVFIPPVSSQVAVTGSVRTPRIFELKANETLGDLLTDAGGTSTTASETRISIERIGEHRDRHTMEVNFDTPGLATHLSDGDLIHVYPISPQYRQTVTLRGNIANPGRFAWHKGMHVTDLIPDKESLLTRDYWWKRAQLGLPAIDFEPVNNFSQFRQTNEVVSLPRKSLKQLSTTEESGLDSDSDTTDIAINQNNQANQPNQLNQPNQFNQPNQASMRSSSGALGAQQSQSQRNLNSTSRAQKTEVRLLTPEIDWDYAVIERTDPETLKTNLIPFDLGRAVLQHDASQDLELQPGDIVSIFSDADIKLPIAQQTKIIRLEGEFVHAGSYSAKPGETLRQLIERAGGLTRNAYLYGSEFDRESTRVLQQARMDEYVRNLEMQMHRGVVALTASSSSDPITATAARNSEDQLIAQLRQVRASGRVVLEFDPAASGIATVPDIALENGDKFVVPSRPANVNVIGAVYNQNSFLFNRTRRVGKYLELAGGPTRSADYKHAFVIRANGEVISRERSGGSLWAQGFMGLRMNPGDTIVVPEKTFKPSALQGMLNWTQLFSQLSLNVAALNTLR